MRLFLLALFASMPLMAHDYCPPPEAEGADVTVYRYSFEAVPYIDAQSTDSEIGADMVGVNEIWAQAGLGWAVAGIVDRRISKRDIRYLSASRATLKRQLEKIAPAGDGWKVVYLRKFTVPAAGLYLPNVKTIYFAETKGGSPTNPVILAHEFGHALSLEHVSDSGNLMFEKAGGSGYLDSTQLTQSQIDAANDQYPLGPK